MAGLKNIDRSASTNCNGAPHVGHVTSFIRWTFPTGRLCRKRFGFVKRFGFYWEIRRSFKAETRRSATKARVGSGERFVCGRLTRPVSHLRNQPRACKAHGQTRDHERLTARGFPGRPTRRTGYGLGLDAASTPDHARLDLDASQDRPTPRRLGRRRATTRTHAAPRRAARPGGSASRPSGLAGRGFRPALARVHHWSVVRPDQVREIQKMDGLVEFWEKNPRDAKYAVQKGRKYAKKNAARRGGGRSDGVSRGVTG